ncbi:B12-binding domain-containing radical SAM protein [Botryobacter ruber]|uniref:B12-binding domain-containing radical SAM protein n=1 Tax=Botryobacter ruber TaxID=2171629 RepID=UPI000E0C5315|nr:radical SAM protein [Botryobacter ruber]
MTLKNHKAILISMSGVRVHNTRLMELGLTLPGFVERSNVIASLPSLGLLSIAAYTPANWEIEYLELDQLHDEEINQLIDRQPDLVAFSALTARINETYLLSAKFRKAGITVVIGGLHASALPEEAMLHADSVIQGEGELIWPVLLQDFENRNLKPLYSSLKDKAYVCNLNEYKTPRYDLLDIARYNRLTLQTTRGCPLNCSFCAASRTISSYKKKPIRQIEKELDTLHEIWPRPFIELADDNTFVDKKWSKDLLRLFRKYKMKWFTETDISIAYDDELLQLLKESNCAQVLIGLETATQESLHKIDRNNWKYRQFDNYYKAIDKIQSYGISVNGCFILGFDTDTTATFERTEQFIKNSNLSEVQITILTPFPGTGLYRQLKQEGRLISENYWEKCTLFDVTYRPKNMTMEEMTEGFQKLMQSIYSPEEVKKRKQKFRDLIKNKYTLPL